MAEDKFGRVAGAVGRGLLKLGASTIPGAAVAQEVAATLLGGKDAEFHQALLLQLVDDVLELQNAYSRLAAELKRRGQKPDELDLIAQRKILHDFALQLAETPGKERRSALTNAAARQFDPRQGSLAVRRFRWQLLTSLNDMQVETLRLTGRGVLGYTDRSPAVLYSGGKGELDPNHLPSQESAKRIELDENAVAAVVASVHELSHERRPPLLTATSGLVSMRSDFTWHLTTDGLAVLELMQEIPPAETGQSK